MASFLFTKNKTTKKRAFDFARLGILTRYFTLYKKEITLLTGLSLFSAFFQAVSPYAAGKIIDSLVHPEAQFVFGRPIIAPAFVFFGAWLITQAITNGVDLYINRKNRYLDEKIFADYLVDAIGHLLKLPMSFHKEKKIGDIENRIQTAAQNISSIISDVIIRLLPQFLSITIALVLAFIINPLLAGLLIVSVVLYVIILTKTTPPYTKIARKMRKAYNKAYGESSDTILNVQSVKQAGAELHEKQKLYKNFHLKALRLWENVVAIRQLMNFSQRALTLATQACVYIISIIFIMKGRMTIGELVMFNGYVGLFLGPFASLSENWNVVQNGLISLERAEGILKEKTEPYDMPNAVILKDISGKVEFSDVTFTYDKNQKTVLKNISFVANPGEVIALVGESGVGKSTMMDLLSRYFDPTSGKILVDDHDIKNIGLRFLRSKIAIVPQEILLFNDTIKNNIAYGSFGASEKRIIAAAKIAHADQFIQEFPKKYKQVVGERGVKLSTGQKQRIAIARAALRNPRILILDEPTSALDARSEKLVEDALSTLMQGRTTFVIAHRLSTVRSANKILVVEKGQIVEQGTHDELIQIEGGFYRTLHDLQIGLKA